MAYALDFQFFKKPGGDMVVKELSIIPIDNNIDPIVLLFKPPFPWRRLTDKYKNENTWLKEKVHGLSWETGDLDYSQLGYMIRDSLKDAKEVYVIGSTKKKFLERFNFNVIDVTDLGYLQVDVTKTVHFCSNHDFEYKINCAAQNVKLIKKFLHAQNEWENISMEWEYA